MRNLNAIKTGTALVLWVWLTQAAAQQSASPQSSTAHQDGVAAGQAANSATKGYVSSGSAAAVVPGYGQKPNETSLYGQPLSGAANQRLVYCAGRPDDPVCQGVTNAYRSAQAPRPTITQGDPLVTGSRAIAGNPQSLLGNLAGTYSDCKVVPVTPGAGLTDVQSCHSYYLRELDQTCIKNLTVSIDYTCPDNTTGPVMTASGRVCRDNQGNNQPARVVERDNWSTGCDALASRVPPGFLLPDGDNRTVSSGSAISDVLNKCERKTSLCLDPASTRTIDGVPVTRACWQYQNSFDCVSADLQSDCRDIPAPGSQCEASGSMSCIDTDTIFGQSVCTASRTDFRCTVTSGASQSNPATVAQCGGQQYCLNGNCFDTGYQADPDFARNVALLEATREAGKYMDQKSQKLFKGYESRCKKKLFGLINCCKKGGGGIGALFSNNQIMSNAADTVINAIGSTYTYDALLAADAPSFILNGFESLFSTGASSALAGMLAGELTVTQFLTTLVPGPWTIAILIIQYSGLLSCPESDKVTAMKRDANLCVTVGSYCSTKLSIIRSCVEQTTKFCCYNSRLAKLINAAGRQQLGRSFGSAQSPDCDGFSMADFQRLDFAKMDLSEFYSDIVPKTPNVGAYTERVRATSQSCYYGNGKCGP